MSDITALIARIDTLRDALADCVNAFAVTLMVLDERANGQDERDALDTEHANREAIVKELHEARMERDEARAERDQLSAMNVTSLREILDLKEKLLP